MKKVAWLLFALVLVIGCNKPSSEVEPIVSRETIGSETVNEATIDVVEEKGSEAPKSELLIKAEEYEAYLQEEYQKYNEQEKCYVFNTPRSVTQENIENNEIVSEYYQGENRKIPAYDFEYDDRNCSCKYRVVSYKGQELEYRAVFIRDPYREKYEDRAKIKIHEEDYEDYYEFDPNTYYFESTELLTIINEKDLKDENADCVIGEAINMVEDEQRNEVIALLEKYHDERHPFYSESKGYVTESRVIDYVKVNLTDSGYDEYLVIYGEYDANANVYYELLPYPKRLSCVLVDGNTVVKDYAIPIYLGYYDPMKDIRAPYSGYKSNFGFEFAHGFINDCNNNNLNEVWYYADIQPADAALYNIEFNGEKFRTNLISDDYFKQANPNPLSNSLIIDSSDVASFTCYDYVYREVPDTDEIELGGGVGELRPKITTEMKYVEEYDEWILVKEQNLFE